MPGASAPKKVVGITAHDEPVGKGEEVWSFGAVDAQRAGHIAQCGLHVLALLELVLGALVVKVCIVGIGKYLLVQDFEPGSSGINRSAHICI